MSDIGGGSSPFDGFFLVLQGVAALLWVAALALLAARKPGPPFLRAALGLQLVATAVLPIVWQLGWPPGSGIEGAGRVLVGAPTSLGNGLLGCAFGFIAGARTEGGWKVGGRFVAAFGAGAAVWLAILLS